MIGSHAESRHPLIAFFDVLSKRTIQWLKTRLTGGNPPSPEQRARDLIAAIDAGGLPLNPARVNDIARQLGLDVSNKSPMQETIKRIRLALDRT